MATQKVVVEGTSVTASQLAEVFRQLGAGELKGPHMQALIEHRNPFDISILDWAKVYELLGLSAEYAEFARLNEAALVIKPGLWTEPVLKGVTCNRVVAVFRKLGVDVYFSNDPDAAVTKNDRDPNRTGSYVVSFAVNVEADQNLKGLSANQLTEQGVKGIILLERLLLELAYFLTTGKHLDVENVTLCSGSRYSDGDVPRVNWHVGSRRLYVHWYDPGSASDSLRTRAVVS